MRTTTWLFAAAMGTLSVPGGGHGGFALADRPRAFAAIEGFLRERGLVP